MCQTNFYHNKGIFWVLRFSKYLLLLSRVADTAPSPNERRRGTGNSLVCSTHKKHLFISVTVIDRLAYLSKTNYVIPSSVTIGDFDNWDKV